MGEDMQLLELRLRLILAGCIVSIIASVLLLVRGYGVFYLGLLIVGIVVLVAGLLWPKPKPKASDPPRDEGE